MKTKLSKEADELLAQTSNKKLNFLLPKIKRRIRERFGEKITKIVLFGSYARGDYNQESDVDICVIVSDSDLQKYRKARVNIITEFLESDEILLSIRIINSGVFDQYKAFLPFYKNVIHEGISLYG